MRQLSAIVIVFFFLCQFLAGGLPSADLDRSGKLDLQDAIIAARGLVNLTEVSQNPAEMGTDAFVQLGNVIEVFGILSGVKTKVQVPKQDSVPQVQAFIALQTGSLLEHVIKADIFTPSKVFSLYSIDLERITPPPRNFC